MNRHVQFLLLAMLLLESAFVATILVLVLRHDRVI